jgi:hypothetical protein
MRDLPTDRVSEGDSPPAALAESGTESRASPPPIVEEAEEVLSRRTPPAPHTGGGGDAVMAEVNTSAAEDQEGRAPLADEEEEAGRAELSPKTTPETLRRPESGAPDFEREEAEAPPPPPPAPERASTGWPDEMEDVLTSSSIAEEHHALMGVVLQSLRSVDNGLKEAFSSLLTGFKVSEVILSF